MSEIAKRALRLADELSSRIMDQLEADRCANKENIRQAIVGILITDFAIEDSARAAKLTPASDVDLGDLVREVAQEPGRFVPLKSPPKVPDLIDLCSLLADRGKAWRDQCDAHVRKVAARQAGKSDAWRKFKESLGPLPQDGEPHPIPGVKGPIGPVGPSAPDDAIQISDLRQAGKSDAADAMLYAMGVDPAARSGVDAPEATIALWKRGHRGWQAAVPATRPLLKALGDAIASGQPRRVSINDGTYVLPDGEVLTELEMIKRSGTDGR